MKIQQELLIININKMIKNTKRRILSRYLENSGNNQYTATVPADVDIEYGISNIVIGFSETSLKTLNIVINFLFEEPASYFWQNNNIKFFGDLYLDNIPANTGTVINMNYVFDSEDDFISMYSQVFSDNLIEISYK